MRLFESVFDELDRIYQKPLTEGWSREENIKKLKELGYRYNFEKYSDSQIYRILEKTLERDARRAAEQAPEAPKPPADTWCRLSTRSPRQRRQRPPGSPFRHARHSRIFRCPVWERSGGGPDRRRW